MSSSPSPSRVPRRAPDDAVVIGNSDVEASARIRRMMPTVKEAAEIAKRGDAVRMEGDETVVSLRGRAVKEFGEAARPAWRAAYEHRMGLLASTKKVSMRARDGRVIRVPEKKAHKLGRACGLVEAPTYSRVRVERGMEGGMMWRLVAGRWEPTGQRVIGTLKPKMPVRGIQVDPGGGVWRGVRGRGWVKVAQAEA